MTCQQPNVFNAGCPSREVLELLAEKWAVLIVHALATGPRRTGELRRQVGGISEKMLIQTLRNLARSGFVERRAYPEVPPRVEYRLTELGQSLAALARALDEWVEQHFAEVVLAQRSFDARQGCEPRPGA